MGSVWFLEFTRFLLRVNFDRDINIPSYPKQVVHIGNIVPF